MAKAARKGLSKKLRFEVFKRDGFACQYCGAHPPSVILHVDHIHPVADGGQNSLDNLLTACESCNQGKGARLLSAVPESLKDRAAQVAEREEQIKGYAEALAAREARIDDDAWSVAEIFMAHFREDSIHKERLQSIKRFVERMPTPEIVRAMHIAIAKKPFSKQVAFTYFCGICWNIIRESEQ